MVGAAPEQFIGSALEQILGGELNGKYPDLAMLVVPWLVDKSYSPCAHHRE